MRSNEFDTSVRAAYHFLLECKLVRTPNTLKSLIVTTEFRQLALDQNSLYEDIYLAGLKNGDYNFLLLDYSFIQFTHFNKDHYRMAYYPNPFAPVETSITEKIEDEITDGFLSFEEYSALLSDQPIHFGIPLVRFELDCNAYVLLNHPTAHFHIGMHAENRWPVARRLSPLIFTLFMVKLYYKSTWIESGAQSNEPDFENRFDRRLFHEKTHCGKLPADLFHNFERGHLHIE